MALIKPCESFLSTSKKIYSNFIKNGYRYLSHTSNSFTVQDEEDFKKRVLSSEKPVIVDFFATWCGPCKMLGPRIEHIVDEKRGRITLAKINVDDNSEIAIDHQVNTIPVLLAFKDGKPGERLVGLKDEDVIRAFVNRTIGE